MREAPGYLRRALDPVWDRNHFRSEFLAHKNRPRIVCCGRKKRKATIHYRAPIDVPDAWVAVDEKGAISYRGRVRSSRPRNYSEYDYHFEKGERLIVNALAAVSEAEENRKKWEGE